MIQAERFAGRSQPSRQNAHHLERKERRLADQKQKLFFGNRNQLDVGDGNCGSTSWRIVDQRHLAENAVGVQFGKGTIAEANPDLSALDDE